MNITQILTLIAAVGGPISGILIAVISNARSKRQVTEDNNLARASVRVDEKDAHTREIAVILDGYTAVNAALNKSLERAANEASECSEKVVQLETRVQQTEETFRVQRAEMIEHIQALENLIPTPPGPPERPAWGQ